jgi:hypothetical protein
VPQQAAEEKLLKINFAIAALFSTAAFLTPAQASSVLFTANTTLPATGVYSSPLSPINLTDGAGSISAYGYDGVFTTAHPTTPSVSGATSASIDVTNPDGLGLYSTPGTTGSDNPYIGQGDAVLLDFANVKSTVTYGGQTGSVSGVEFNINVEGTGTDWVVYGFNNTTGTGTGTYITEGSTGTLGATGTGFIPTSTLYQSYLIGILDCSITITSVDIQYSGTTTTTTPEPGTFVMAGIALIGLGVTMKRRNRKA